MRSSIEWHQQRDVVRVLANVIYHVIELIPLTHLTQSDFFLSGDLYMTFPLILLASVSLLLFTDTSNAGDGTSVGNKTVAKKQEKGSTVFQSNFAKEATDEWSDKSVTTAPKSGQNFLGPFRAKSITLTLGDLPKHERVRLSFDLFVIQSWDGNYKGEGPDLFDVTVDHGPRLMHTTFVNRPNLSSRKQSYPDEYGISDFQPLVGAAKKNTLGYIFYNQISDSIYHVERTFSHSDKSVKIAFAATNIDDEQWGLDDVKVEVLDARAEALEAAEVRRAWLGLQEKDGAKAAAHINSLTHASDANLVELRKTMLKTEATDEDNLGIRKLIADLDSSTSETRVKAYSQLQELGEVAFDELRRVVENPPTPEAKTFAQQILKQASPEGNQRRILRLIHVLELIGRPAAHEILTELGKQTDNTVISTEANEAIKRLSGKSELLVPVTRVAPHEPIP